MYKLHLFYSDDNIEQCISIIIKQYVEDISYITYNSKMYFGLVEDNNYLIVGNSIFNIDEYRKFTDNFFHNKECTHIGTGISFLNNKITFNINDISYVSFYLSRDERVQFSNELKKLEYLLNYSDIIIQ